MVMTILKSTAHIRDNPWEISIDDIDPLSIIPTRFWNNIDILKIEDVNLWEQIYFQSGNIAVYAAWDPYADFYMITYNLFINSPLGIETFYGSDSQEIITKKLEKYGIKLPIWNYRTN